MPTEKGWPTADEERTLKDLRRAAKRGEAITDEQVKNLQVSIVLSVESWQAVIAALTRDGFQQAELPAKYGVDNTREDAARDYIARSVTAFIERARGG